MVGIVGAILPIEHFLQPKMSVASLAALSIAQQGRLTPYTLNRDVFVDFLLDPGTGPDQLDDLLASNPKLEQWLDQEPTTVQQAGLPAPRRVDLDDLYSRMNILGANGYRFKLETGESSLNHKRG